MEVRWEAGREPKGLSLGMQIPCLSFVNANVLLFSKKLRSDVWFVGTRTDSDLISIADSVQKIRSVFLSTSLVKFTVN